MFQAIKTFFSGNGDKQPKNTAYKTRQNTVFNGEKQSGSLSYPSSYQIDQPAMVRRSLKAYEESMQARAATNRLNDSVINTGLTLESTPMAEMLGISAEQRKTISNIIESKYSLWSKSKNCDASGNNTLGQIERLAFNSQLIKGEYFGVLSYNFENKNLMNPLQIRMITPERISTPFGTNDKKEAEGRGNRIVSGIEIDENGGEVAFYIRSKKPGSFISEWKRIERVSESGRVVVIHGNRQRFGDEVRGIPFLANVAHELEKVTDYSLLEVMAAIANATVAMTVVPSGDAPATNPFPSSTMIPPGRGPDDTVINEEFGAGYTNVGVQQLENAGGLLVSSLNAGEKLESHDTKRPNVNFGAFVDSITKALSASLGIPIEILDMKFGNSFSASRASLKLFWQSLAVWRDEFVSDFLTPVYQSWLLAEVGTGKIVLRGFDDASTRAAWSAANWIGIESPSIDPVKEAKAAKERVANGDSTHEYEAQKYNGSSFDSNVERLKSENKNLAEALEPFQQQEKVA